MAVSYSAAAACSVLLALSPGCGKAKQPKRQSTESTSPPSATASTAGAQERPAQPRLVASSRNLPGRLRPIAAAELGDAIRLPPEAVVLSLPTKPQAGERVHATYCYAGGVADAAAAIGRSLESQGWSPVHVRVATDDPDRAGVAGQRTPYRLSASLKRTPMAECSGDDGKTFVRVTLHKLAMTPPLPPPQRATPR